jgi:hypothetical protein
MLLLENTKNDNENATRCVKMCMTFLLFVRKSDGDTMKIPPESRMKVAL